jgi:hypothetical protein
MGWQSKKFEMHGLRILRSEAYLPVCPNDERGGVRQPFGFAQGHEPVEWQLDFLRSRQMGVN